MTSVSKSGAIEPNRDEIEVGFEKWYEREKCAGAPIWKRIWANARKVRDGHSHEPRATDEELIGFVYRTADYCFKKFDRSRGQQGKEVSERFIQMFAAKLRCTISDSRKIRRKSRSRWRKSKNNYDPLARPLCLWLRDAVDALNSQDRELLHRRYWERETFREIANGMSLGKSTIEDRHAKILKAMEKELRGYIEMLSEMGFK